MLRDQDRHQYSTLLCLKREIWQINLVVHLYSCLANSIRLTVHVTRQHKPKKPIYRGTLGERGFRTSESQGKACRSPT